MSSARCLHKANIHVLLHYITSTNQELSLWTVQEKALCIPPAVSNLAQGLGKGLNEQTPTMRTVGCTGFPKRGISDRTKVIRDLSSG